MKKYRITNDILTIPYDGKVVANEGVPIQDGQSVPNRSSVEAQLSNMVD